MIGGLAGPAALGRGVVVAGNAPVPAPWVGCSEVVVDEAALGAPEATVATLHRAWANRTPVVVRLGVDAARFRSPASFPVEPWTLGPDFEVWADRLQFLCWANNFDARRPGDPVWWWSRKAARLGAGVGTEADIVLPDGRSAWIDGGPRGPVDTGEVAVVHREALERGSLRADLRSAAGGAEGLADDQRAAVDHPAGPARVIAPAGSGKTRVLTARLRRLVVDRGWDRDAVLAVAYNRKAQQELDARSVDFAPRTRTLNSLGLAILTRGRRMPPTVLEEREVRRIVERLAPPVRRRSNTDPIGPYLDALGAVRLGLRDPEAVEAESDDVPGLAALWPGFRDELRRRGAVDFDEQIYGAVELLLADGDSRAREQLGCRHLLVDEFQDLTPAHVLLLRLLATPGLDCFGVGDDDQVIYGHAGADPGFLIDYERLFPSAGDHPLRVNYRCPPAVVDGARRLLARNHRRVPKDIEAGRTSPSGGLEVRRHPSGEGAEATVGQVRAWAETGSGPRSMAVLARVNSLLLAPHVALVTAGVPVDSAVRPDLLSRTGLRAALASLRIAVAPDGYIPSADLIEILRRPSRGLPPWFSDRLRRRSRFSDGALAAIAGSVPDKDAPKVEGLVADVALIRTAAGEGADTAALLTLVRDGIGLGTAMNLLDGGRGGESSSHVDDLDALEQVARLHPDPTTFESWLGERLTAPSDPDGVTVSTIHRVKGMEWDRVIVYGVTAGILPHRLAEDVEEERRVFHVGITRAREEAVVLSDIGRASPFLAELTGEAPEPVASTGSDGGRRLPLGSGREGAPGPGRSARRGRRSEAAGSGRPAAAEAADPALEEALRAWRRERSQRDGVPAYIVFSDRTLTAIAARCPGSPAALRAVDGIGPTKLELYGDEVLALVAERVGSTS